MERMKESVFHALLVHLRMISNHGLQNVHHLNLVMLEVTYQFMIKHIWAVVSHVLQGHIKIVLVIGIQNVFHKKHVRQDINFLKSQMYPQVNVNNVQ